MEFPLEEKYDFKGFFLMIMNFHIEKDIITIILINFKNFFQQRREVMIFYLLKY